MTQKDLYVNAPATLFIIVQNYNKQNVFQLVNWQNMMHMGALK